MWIAETGVLYVFSLTIIALITIWAVCGVMAIYIETKLNNSSVIARSLAPFLMSLNTLTLATNVLVTCASSYPFVQSPLSL